MEILLYAIILLLLLSLLLQWLWRNSGKQEADLTTRIDQFTFALQRLEAGLKEDFRLNREENNRIAKENRDELNGTLIAFQKQMTDTLYRITEQAGAEAGKQRVALQEAFTGFQNAFDKNVESFNNLQREKFSALESKQLELVRNTETKLESIRVTVEEKLEKTLADRLGQSFETVGKQLIEVQKGLGEMQTLAQDVGGLKKVLSNVKMRGGIGEVQLAMLLEQILAPEQYEANVKTKSGSADLQNQVSRFSGNVVITQGTMVIKADRMEVRLTPDGYHVGTAWGAAGAPVSYRQKRDGVDEHVEGLADRVEFDGKTEVMRFIGNGVVRRVRGSETVDEITGALITWNHGTEQFSVQGGTPSAGNPGGRVRAVLSPRPAASGATR